MKLRRSPLVFAILALAICTVIIGLVNRFYPDKLGSGHTTAFASDDCQNWMPEAAFGSPDKRPLPKGLFLKSGTKITQLKGAKQISLTVEKQSEVSTAAKEFVYEMMGADYLLVISSRTFGLLDMQDMERKPGLPGLTEASIKYGQLAGQGEWSLNFENGLNHTLRASVKSLGFVTCTAEGCLFSEKANVVGKPLTEHPEALKELKAQGYFDKKLQSFRDACSDIREPMLRSAMGFHTAEFQNACMLDDVSTVVTISMADLACQALEKDLYPQIAKLAK